MALSKENTRPGRAAVKMGDAIIATVHLMYQDDTAKIFLDVLIRGLFKELKRRIRS